MRISVAMILELLAQGLTSEEILEEYPQLESDDIKAALMYGFQIVEHDEVYTKIAV